ncbi:MAG: NUDIX hydrolase [Chitinispirillaceae bacterium]|jgi:8-oxo-dGTP pyrophosphatase MutT (NUDIX family)|nr:NUDIX hydrolase [Chitinispirillaceae bacterium]
MNTSHEPKISAWTKSVKDAGCAINKLDAVSVLTKRNGELLFALLDADVRDPDNNKLPNYVFIRGDACLIVPLIRNRETGEEKYLMIRQRRIGNGSLSLEFPAGMLDTQVSDPLGVAVRELAEETGIETSPDKLFPLCDSKLFSSVGASDEAIYYYGCIIELDDAVWKSLGGRLMSNPDEDEHIAVSLMSRDEAQAEATSLQVRLGFYLFEEYLNKITG